MKNNKIEVSIVIPAFNEEKYLSLTLESISKLNNKDFEVIVVDNNSEDKTAQIAESFKTKINLRVVLEKKKGRGAARFRGFSEALGSMILSTDADTIVYPEWLDMMVKDIKGEIIATTSSCRIEDCPYLTRILFNFIQPASMVLYRIIFGHFWFSGFSFAILKSTYEKSGGFNPNLQVQEDLDLSFKVAKLGKIKFINKPVIPSGRRFKKGLISGLFEYIKTFTEIFVFKKRAYLDNPR